jgi:hypothetical protein
MIVRGHLLLVAVVTAASILLSTRQLRAFELAGAWATNAEQCGKVFARKGRDATKASLDSDIMIEFDELPPGASAGATK